MRVCLIFIFFLSATFASSAKSKSQGKQHGMQKAAHSAKEKDDITMDPSRPQVFPTLITFDASSQEHEEEVISGDNTNAKEDDKEGKEKTKKRNAVLMSEEELADLLKKEAEENESVEEREEDDNDMALAIHEDEITLKDEKKLDEAEKKTKYKEEKEDNNTHEEEVEVEKPASKMNLPDGQLEFLEERESSTESELPADRDYAADSGKIIPVQENQKSASQTNLEDTKKKEVGEKVLLVQNMQSSAAGDSEKMADQSEDLSAKSKEKDPSKRDPKAPMDRQKVKSRVGLKSGLRWSEKVEDKGKSDGAAFLKRKTRQQKKNKRSRKHSPRSDETNPVQDQGQLERQESEGSSGENVPNKANRKRNGGKWGPLVGANPVQIRASLDLYPRSRSSSSRDLYLSGAPTDPCENYRCKRGKTCKLDADGKPGCVCQEPLECPLSIYEFEHVCGTDNKTYETSCELFSTKCNLEGTKRGSRLHLDYTGPCKLIPDCVEDELVQFPLRMRDWLKNVLLQLYEHDSTSQNFLTPKQRFRVKKIFENDRRLHAGNHSVVLLAQDFEKNYNMYIYPVHWQFAQLDQHPSDRILSHSELAPLRVPLVPLEHCTSPFFQGCDADKDKQITLKEWTSCFEIKDEDMDVNMLF